MYEYTYLLLSSLFLIIWLAIFILRKDLRKPLLIMSIFGLVVGAFTDIVYQNDWWSPQTITNTSFSIESTIGTFAIAGVAAFIYKFIFNKKSIEKRKNKKKEDENNKRIASVLLIAMLIFYGGFYLFNLNSFLITILGALVPIAIMYYKRKDLIKGSVISGFLMILIASTIYTILEFATPGWINVFWHFSNVPEIIILNVPIDDVIWYFLAGAFSGSLYDYWKGEKIVNN